MAKRCSRRCRSAPHASCDSNINRLGGGRGGLLSSSLPLVQRREEGRVALVAEFDNGGKPLAVYNLHLESKGTEQLRLDQIEEVLDDAQRYPSETPVIVAGDLNTFVFHSRLIPRLRAAGFRRALGDRRVRTHLNSRRAGLGFRPRFH